MEKSTDSTEKSAFKLVQLPGLMVICWKLMKIYSCSWSKWQNFTDVCMVGETNLLPIIQTYVNFHNYAELHCISSLI